MSAIILQYFTVTLENKPRNIHALAHVIAESDVQAIELVKERTKENLLHFMNRFMRAPGKELNHPFPEDFWDDTKITAEVAMQPKVVSYNYDKIEKDSGFRMG
jgi:hypothetical protein